MQNQRIITTFLEIHCFYKNSISKAFLSILDNNSDIRISIQKILPSSFNISIKLVLVFPKNPVPQNFIICLKKKLKKLAGSVFHLEIGFGVNVRWIGTQSQGIFSF